MCGQGSCPESRYIEKRRRRFAGAERGSRVSQSCLHKDGVAKDEFVLHCDTIDSPSTYTGRGESDFGEYTIVGECINGELDSAEFKFRKLV